MQKTVEIAFNKSIKSLSNISAPLVIISVIKYFRDATNFIMKNFIITSLMLSLLAVIFFVKLFGLLKSKIYRPQVEPKISRKRKLVALSIIFTAIALYACTLVY